MCCFPFLALHSFTKASNLPNAMFLQQNAVQTNVALSPLNGMDVALSPLNGKKKNV